MAPIFFDRLFITAWFLGLVFLLFLASLAGFSPFRVTVGQLFVVQSLGMSYFGYPLLYFHFYPYRVSRGLTDPEIIAAGMGAALVAIAVSLVVVLIPRNTGSRRNSGSIPYEHGFEKESSVSILYWSILLAVVVAILAKYLSKVPSMALFEAFSGGDAALARSKLTNDFQGKYHWYPLFFYDVAWLVTLVFFACALKAKRLIPWALLGISLLITTFGLTMSAQKAPLAWFLISLFLVYFFIKNDGQIGVKKSIGVGVVAIAVLIPSYLVFMGSDSFVSALYSISSRAFTGQLSGAYNYQLMFPNQVCYLLGTSFPKPREVFPFEHYRLAVEVMKLVSSNTNATDVVGSQPNMYWGEAYANFGWLGIPAVALFVGGVLLAALKILDKVQCPEVKGAATVWVGLQISYFANSGFTWALMPVTFAVGFLLIFAHEVTGKSFFFRRQISV
mgnify:CR=1 FL=1